MRQGDNMDNMSEAERQILPLLSGWLDGELTPEEAERVERALEGSAALRTVIDEWRSVEQTIDAQEPVRSEADWEALAMRVDRAIAAETGVQASLHPDDARQKTAHRASSWWERFQEWFTPRRWAFGSTGALAALVLLVLLWPRSDQWLNSTGVLKNEQTPAVDRPQVAQGEGAERELSPKLAEEKPARKERQADLRADAPEPPAGSVSSPKASEGAGVVPKAEIPTARTPVAKRPQRASAGRVGESTAEVDRAEESVRDDSVRKDDADQSVPTPRRSMAPEPAPPAPAERIVARQFIALQSHEDWIAPMKHRLQAALEARNHDDLRGVLAEIDQHRLDTPADAGNVAVLALAVRARSEYARLFPGAEGSADACTAIRADYAAFLRLADETFQESQEGLQVRDLVHEVCPE